ncbi:hypothetical protein HNQ36_003041 [Afipia massiliensis]|uniref:Uncharacterized protein n=1 Tax=Afipia massiliensis TaxID=211460 RepID=A0A840N1V3_9BRAD|nr:hypothetical protein [Afipia massiliensis]MBB5053050.1 hypothetical protein [Afipia massiliensis]
MPTTAHVRIRVPPVGETNIQKETVLSHRIDFETYLKSQLVKASSKLKNKNPPDIYVAGQLDRIVATAAFISSGYWAKIAPLYEPLAPKLQLSVKHLNEDLVSGAASAPDFDAYIALLVERISEPVSV